MSGVSKSMVFGLGLFFLVLPGAAQAEAPKSPITAGAWKLYSQPRTIPSPSCDLHTALTIDAQAHARLFNAVGGTCEIAAVPDMREYTLTSVTSSCGSKIYKGSFTKDGKTSSVTITDHRPRVCQDVVPARVVVEETRPGAAGPVTTLKYSSER
jgi:hypothetical protein